MEHQVRAHAATPPSSDVLLDIRDLQISYDGETTAVRKASLQVNRGEIVAIVGESGSGKSTLAMSVMGLFAANGRIDGGTIEFEGRDLSKVGPSEWLRIRGEAIGLVPQDPMSNLNPMMRVGRQVGEVLLRHKLATSATVDDEVCRVLARAGIDNPRTRLRQFPHELSGGLRQRVLIAIGTACEPQLLIADEPTSALDVTVQRVILDQIDQLSQQMGMAVLLITHDLALAAERAHRVVVMKSGEIVESGDAGEILRNPKHPYTQLLVNSDPGVRARQGITLRKTRPVTEQSETAIEVRGIAKVYRRNRRAEPVVANADVTFDIARGRTLALVGESGSGKTTVSRILLLLANPSSGQIRYEGKDIGGMNRRERAAFRRRVQPVFQDPYSSLNPMMTVRGIIQEPLNHYRVGTRRQRRQRVIELMDEVALPKELLSRHPAELSGGQRQRVAIARAIALRPEILVCDEPVSALDVVVQKQILSLLARLQQESDLTYLFISHDLAVVREIADVVCVMKHGRVVECAPVDTIYGRPQHEYTRQLLQAAGMSS